MIRSAFRVALVAIPVVLLALAGGGCSSFQSHQRVNLAPFAEDMIALAGGIEYELGRLQPVYLQGYVDVPEHDEHEIIAGKLRATMRGVIGYSIQVVTLAESELTGTERTQALADYLDGLLRPVLVAPLPPLQITIAELDTILADVRNREDLLGGLRAAQPIVDEIARVSGELFDEARTGVERIRAAIERRIDADFAEVVVADRELRNFQLRTVLDIAYLPMMRGGDLAAVDSLRAHQPSLRKLLRSGVQPTEAQLVEMEQRLVFILDSLSTLREQMAPDLEFYRAAKRELGLMANDYNAEIRKGRVAMITWARAHGRLSQGVTDPAAIDVMGIARKAAGNVLPL